MFLLNWAHEYCSSNKQSKRTIHLYPLQDINIQFVQKQSQADHYFFVTQIKPHCFLNNIDGHLKLTSQVNTTLTREK